MSAEGARLFEALAEVERLTGLLERNGCRWCLCSRADRMHDRANPECPLHGEPLHHRLRVAREALAAVAALTKEAERKQGGGAWSAQIASHDLRAILSGVPA